ncbi:MAG TPA: hypothetical protein VHK06_05485 [Candidatus Limnocylindria bacterium]|nr:hypothetical protein [Candidatus Limnocylindria bacterium]
MSVDVRTSHTRRALLAGALGGAAALAARALGRPVRTAAATGDPVIAGQSNTADATTILAKSEGGFPALDVDTPSGTAIIGRGSLGVQGESHDPQGLGTGVFGLGGFVEGGSSIGVHGDGDTGLLGTGAFFGGASLSWALGVGMYGSASDSAPPPVHLGAGVIGQSDEMAGLVGFTGLEAPQPTPHTGIYGRSTTGGTAGRGLAGHCPQGIGLLGQTDTGTGVRAYAGQPAGLALRVSGRAAFDRSGRATIATNASSVTVTPPNFYATSSTFVLATLQQNRAGVHVQSVVVTTGSAGRFTIHLNKPVPAATSVAWMAVN